MEKVQSVQNIHRNPVDLLGAERLVRRAARELQQTWSKRLEFKATMHLPLQWQGENAVWVANTVLALVLPLGAC